MSAGVCFTALLLFGEGPESSTWEADDWDPSEFGEAMNPAASEDDSGLREEEPGIGDIVTGSVRLTGAFMHFDDLPELFPNRNDALVATVARVMVDQDFGEHVDLELNIFGELSRAPFGRAGGTFASAGSTRSAYRSSLLDASFVDQGSVQGTIGLDRLAVGFNAGRVRIDVGRFPINNSVTFFITPNDFFAPFSATAVNKLYKPGVDATRVSVAVGTLSTVELVGVLGYDDGVQPAWGQSGLLARASIVGAGFDWAITGGKVARRWVVGASAQGDIGIVGLRGEGHFGVPDVAGDGRSGSDEDRALHVRLAAGPSLNFAWHNMSLGAEYAYASDGGRRPDDYLARAQALEPDELPYLGRHYVGASLGGEIIPILRAGLFGLVNAGDGSGLAGVSLIYSVSDEADMVAGAYVPWGKDAEPGAAPPATLQLGSEFGLAPLNAYLEMRVFF